MKRELTSARLEFITEVNRLLVKNGYEAVEWKTVRQEYEAKKTALETARDYIENY